MQHILSACLLACHRPQEDDSTRIKTHGKWRNLLSPALQVDNVHTLWGGMLGHCVGDSQDLLDLYARQLQLYEDHDPRRQRILASTVAMLRAGGIEESDRSAEEEG